MLDSNTISLSRIIERSNADAPPWEASSLSGAQPLPWPESSLPIGFARGNSCSGAVDIGISGRSSKSGTEHSRSALPGSAAQMCGAGPESFRNLNLERL